MNRVFLPLLIPLLLISIPVAAQYQIPYGTFGCGGGIKSGTHNIYDTAGQAGADSLGGASYSCKLGFWYLAELGSAVDVAMVSFEGRYSDQGVLLFWTMRADTPFDGYDIYRAEGESDQFERINGERVAALESAEYTDRTALPGRIYNYYISAVSEGGELFRSQTVTVNLPPKPVTLYQNFPNPFNPSTIISFFIPERSPVRLDIFDTGGKRVDTVVNGIKSAGRYNIEWNGFNSGGNKVSSGVYFYRLTAGRKILTRKLVLMR